jgi:hypothetical protein
MGGAQGWVSLAMAKLAPGCEKLEIGESARRKAQMQRLVRIARALTLDALAQVQQVRAQGVFIGRGLIGDGF